MQNVTSKEIAAELMRKIKDAQEGKNLSGAESMCRCVDTLIKLARLEMDYARMRNEKPALAYLSNGEGLVLPPAKPSAIEVVNGKKPTQIDKAVDKVAARLKGTW